MTPDSARAARAARAARLLAVAKAAGDLERGCIAYVELRNHHGDHRFARELFRATGFYDDYLIDPLFEGEPLTRTAQVRMCGNAVPPDPAEALIRANLARAA